MIGRLGGDRRGVAGVEFAFALPVLLVLTVGLVEIGRVINQTTMVQKALRNAASYAARHQFPLDSQTETEIANIVKYGNPAGGSQYVLAGWGKPSAALEITTTAFNVDGAPVGGTVIPVVRLNARVPFDPILGGFLPIAQFDIKASHDQGFIGD